MAKNNKFGTFGGVYTPSVLTILGVIMYMRLSWIVGNAGTLIAAIGIIIVAHIVSISTGLSVSSVATDKKIKGGGIYYMLSRSLGFPIGGAIGIAIFLATSLGISLYLIGFAESFLEITKDWFGIEQITTNNLRIVGTIILLVIVTLAFISTSLAIKSQYFILSLIGLSLVSIFFGTSQGKGFDSSAIPAGAEVIPFATLFGIFFPAVTGFTSGVAMSGDLNNPKKSIPWGTMLAIGSGFLIYVGLTVFISNRIPISELRNNTNVLVEFSWIPQLVFTGIWGATLSSALGGILGAPRIFQAMSSDSIMPKFFAKVIGEGKEPRRALILTAIISECGIMIGELDAIAGIVTMFFMTGYLFINLSCFLEQWASPDFRPTFKIPLVVSLIGALATMLMMIQLDLLAALMSVFLMTVIFLWLSRKQLVLGSGDVWQSVWGSVVKFGLKRLSTNKTHERNWVPNILLFSGSSNIREHLLEMSKSIAGRNGMISNFDLVENASAKNLFPKYEQKLDSPKNDNSIFYRRQECKNIYQGMESIAQTYGFSGVEPNTIMLGWSHKIENAQSFRKMLNTLHDLDYSVLYLNYDEQKGFGNKKKIDIWWRDLSQVSYLTVQMTKLLTQSEDWGEAEIRFIYLNDYNAAQHTIARAMNNMTKELNGAVKVDVLNNELQRKSFYDVVSVESHEADLTIIDMPIKNDDDEFISETDLLFKKLGTTILLRASSTFNKGEIVNLDLERQYAYTDTDTQESLEKYTISLDNIIPLYTSSCEELNKNIVIVDQAISVANKKYVTNLYDNISKNFDSLILKVSESEDLSDLTFSEIEKSFFDMKKKMEANLVEELTLAIKTYFLDIEPIISNLPKSVKRGLSRAEIKEIISQLKKDEKRDYEKYNKVDYNTKIKSYISVKKILKKQFNDDFMCRFYSAMNIFGSLYYDMSDNINFVFESWNGEFDTLKDVKMLHSVSGKIKETINNNKEMFFKELSLAGRKYLNLSLCMADGLVKNELIIDKISLSSKKYKSEIFAFPSSFFENLDYIINRIVLGFALFRIKYNIVPSISRISSLILNNHVNELKEIKSEILGRKKIPSSEKIDDMESSLLVLSSQMRVNNIISELGSAMKKIVKSLPVSELVSIINHENYEKSIYFKNVNIRKVVDYLLENNVLQPLELVLQKYFTSTQPVFIRLENTIKLIKLDVFERNENDIELLNKVDSELEESFTTLETELQHLISECNEILTDDNVINNAEDLHSVIRKEINEKGLKRISKKVESLYLKILHKVNDVYIRGLDSMNQSYSNNRIRTIRNINSSWRDVVDYYCVNEDKDTGVPFYYQQLFNNNSVNLTKIPERQYEWSRFDMAYKKFKQGYSGILFITGEPLSGKTLFIDNITKVNRDEIVFHINSSRAVLRNPALAFKTAVKRSAILQNINIENLEDLPKGSIIVIDNLEFWWNRTARGNTQIEYILEQIKNNYKDYFFIVSSNVHFFRFIRQCFSLDELLSDTIFMNVLKIDEISESILERHNLSGIKIYYGEDQINKIKLDKILKNISLISGGNIGMAYLLWMSSFSKFENGNLYIKEIKSLSLAEVNGNLWNSILVQIILHKHIRLKTFYEIYKDVDKDYFSLQLESLCRTGVVVHNEVNVYRINPYAQILVTKYLRNIKSID